MTFTAPAKPNSRCALPQLQVSALRHPWSPGARIWSIWTKPGALMQSQALDPRRCPYMHGLPVSQIHLTWPLSGHRLGR